MNPTRVWSGGIGARHRSQVAGEIAGAATVDAAGVSEIDFDFLDIRLGETERFEPFRRARTAAGGVDDEVRHHMRRLAGVALHANAGDASALCDQAEHVIVVDDANVRHVLDLTADRCFQERAAEEQTGESALEARFVVPVLEPAHAADHVAGNGPRVEQLALERREQPLQAVEAARQQTVTMTALRNT